jgi:uncharacterized membrane protein YgcG
LRAKTGAMNLISIHLLTWMITRFKAPSGVVGQGRNPLPANRNRGESERLNIDYTRVLGAAQKPDLVNQVKALEQLCAEQAIVVDEWMQDIGSGMERKSS